MGRKIDLDKAIGHILAHKEAVKVSKDNEIAEAMNESYGLAHDHIIEILIVLANEEKI